MERVRDVMATIGFSINKKNTKKEIDLKMRALFLIHIGEQRGGAHASAVSHANNRFGKGFREACVTLP